MKETRIYDFDKEWWPGANRSGRAFNYGIAKVRVCFHLFQSLKYLQFCNDGVEHMLKKSMRIKI